MKLAFALSLIFAGALAARADTPSVLATAIQKLTASDDEWAYTQVIRRTDRTSGDTIARFDPSKPAGEQWELLQLRGHAPTETEAANWCKKRSRETNQTDGRAFVELLDLDNASVLQADRGHVVYQIPLRKNTIAHVPTENFVAYAEVDSVSQLLEKLSVVLKQSIRLVGGIAQVESAEGEVVFRRFGDDDARPDHIVAHGTGQALFRRVSRSGEIIFTDQRRVKS